MSRGASEGRSVALVSGGMDSCVTAAIALAETDAAFLHVSYGQRTEAKERACFESIAEHYGVRRRLVARLDHLGAIGGSSLTDASRPIPVFDPDRREAPTTYVPFRNAQLLSVAVSWAEVLGAGRIYIGAVEEDSSGYPDCRRVFFDAFETMVAAGARPGANIRVVTPLIGLRKKEIVARGLQLQAPLHLTWSCYQAEQAACGTCDSCALRLRGFREAGASDPIPYHVRHAAE
ncbi:MAG TPA: 7-cyano-7-deazaguanine synthase QueC [Candidatus Polarisedimenticolia bacterium]|nr:7-cyano-7-deazaguanine synthase QueC [Candidatus Polarisedimenticolia bacterium]